MDELKNMAPNLSKIKKETPYRVPDDYFDNFASRLDEKISSQNEQERRKNIFIVAKPYLAVAASIAVLMIIAFSVFRIVEIKHTPDVLTKDEIMAYIKDDIYDYDETTIVENLSSENVTSPKNELSDQEIIEYLQNEGVDVSTISNEF